MPAQQSLPTAPPRPGTPHSAFPLRGVICSASSLQTRSCTPCDGRRPAVLTDGDEGHEAPHARARVGAASLFSGCALWSAGRGGFYLLVIADAVGVVSVCVQGFARVPDFASSVFAAGMELLGHEVPSAQPPRCFPHLCTRRSPHLHQLSLFSFFFNKIMAGPTGVKWYLLVVSICISPTAVGFL